MWLPLILLHIVPLILAQGDFCSEEVQQIKGQMESLTKMTTDMKTELEVTKAELKATKTELDIVKISLPSVVSQSIRDLPYVMLCALDQAKNPKFQKSGQNLAHCCYLVY